VHKLFGSFLPLPPVPSLSPPHPLLPGRIYSALISNFVEEKKKHNKKDKDFLLVELTIAIHRDS
jgi:hypothetical protein